MRRRGEPPGGGGAAVFAARGPRPHFQPPGGRHRSQPLALGTLPALLPPQLWTECRGYRFARCGVCPGVLSVPATGEGTNDTPTELLTTCVTTLADLGPKRCGCRGPEERLHAQAATTSADTARQLQTELGFRMVCSGRTDLVPHGLQLLPRLDCLDPRGLSPLMVAAVQGDEALVQTLLDLGASPDIEVGGLTSGIVGNTAAILNGSCCMG
ncbi:ABTB2 [Cordylochernes scorpioides]|uniref:ABTB2 n=1 Tax=Cordylochernes scorpioides TaxID=51811 RepID=A0ABY6L6M8_9ARAC|nr:ABTB2 [Cordylochernes scorpioides]